MDISLDFGRIPLCGRENELFQLVQATVGRSMDASRQAVLVEGQSGSGKTMLLRAFRERVITENGFCIIGKHEELANDAFGALGDALTDLVSQVLTHKSFSKMKEQTKLGLNNQQVNLLATICPQILRIAESRANEISRLSFASVSSAGSNLVTNWEHIPRDVLLTSVWVFQQLGLAVRALFRIVSSYGLVVLVQDDIQWAKKESWSLLEATIVDSLSPNFVFLGAHRPGPDSPMVLGLMRLQGPEFHIETIKLNNFDVNTVAQLTACLTRRSLDECMTLAEVLHRRTDGQVMFLIQFLGLLEKKKLVYYSTNKLSWEWNLDAIVSETSIPDSVADIIAGRLSDLTDGLKAALVVAAHIGPSRFDVRVLGQLLQFYGLGMEKCIDIDEDDDTVTKLHSFLQVAASEGLLEILGEYEYKFAHDRIRESTRLLAVDRGPTFDVTLGTALVRIVDQFGEDNEFERHTLLLLGVNHLNAGKSFITEEQALLDLVKLNMKAAEISFKRIALNPTRAYLEFGLDIIETLGGWSRHYSLLLNMSNLFVQVLYSVGDFGKCCEVAEGIRSMAKSCQERNLALQFKFFALHQLGRPKEAFSLATSVLRELGFPFPQRKIAAKFLLVKNIMNLKATATALTEEKLLKLPEVADRNVLAAVEIFMSLIEMANNDADVDTMVLATLYALKLTCRYGFTPDSPKAMVSSAIILVAMGDYDSADKIGHAAIKLGEKVGNLCRAQVLVGLSCYCIHWRQPLSKALNISIEAKQIIIDHGYVPTLYYVCFSYTVTYLMSGLSLEPLSKDVIKMHEMVCDLRLHKFSQIYETFAQFVLNLMVRSQDNLVLSGEVIKDQDASWKMYEKSQNGRAMSCMRTCRMFLGFFFDDMDLALSMWRKLPSLMKEGPSFLVPFRLFVQGLIAFEWARRSPCGRKLSFLREGKNCLHQLNQMLKSKCVNVYHLVLILQAEQMSFRGDSDAVRAAYDNGISSAGRLGFTNVQAIGNELAGSYFFIRGDAYWARSYLTRASTLYGAWGAKAKVEQVRTKYAKLLEDIDCHRPSLIGSGHLARERFEEFSTLSHSITSSADMRFSVVPNE